jgi:dynein heavy chain, axonemal
VVNFSVNLESLQAQMLAIVVLNERKDLDDIHTKNSKEAFDSIKSLKDIESRILKLEAVNELLGDDELIEQLADSKNTTEYIAAKLKNIAQTNQFLSKARDIYAPDGKGAGGGSSCKATDRTPF